MEGMAVLAVLAYNEVTALVTAPELKSDCWVTRSCRISLADVLRSELDWIDCNGLGIGKTCPFWLTTR